MLVYEYVPALDILHIKNKIVIIFMTSLLTLKVIFLIWDNILKFGILTYLHHNMTLNTDARRPMPMDKGLTHI